MNPTRSSARARSRTVHREGFLAAGPVVFSLLPTALPATGCANIDTPYTYVVMDNKYPASAAAPLVVYRAYWQAVAFATPVAPGSSSALEATVPASDNMAWVVLAPGWDPSSSSPPASFVVMQSRSGFAVHLDNILHIPVDDSEFAGNCATGSALTQSEADFITQRVFPSVFQGLQYDAATCATSPIGDAGLE
ncbi:MAG: hypothetical protein ABSC94_24945 [Polyangiaceae bacterium]